jgi:hypothetical protein
MRFSDERMGLYLSSGGRDCGSSEASCEQQRDRCLIYHTAACVVMLPRPHTGARDAT